MIMPTSTFTRKRLARGQATNHTSSCERQVIGSDVFACHSHIASHCSDVVSDLGSDECTTPALLLELVRLFAQ